MSTALEWVLRTDALRQEQERLDNYFRSGVSKAYARAFAADYAWVNSEHLKLFARHHVPVEYAVAAITAGHDAQTVVELWDSGVSVEYARIRLT